MPTSASPEITTARPDDAIVTLLSAWLAFHASNGDLQHRLAAIGTDGLLPKQIEAVDELLAELETAPPYLRGDLEMLVRETLEVVALG